MQIKRKMRYRGQAVWAAVFLAGFLAGIAAVCFLPTQLVSAPGFLDAASFARLKSLKIDAIPLFCYALRQRMTAAFFLILLALAGLGGVGAGLFSFWCGASAGMVMTALSLRYGPGGLLLFAGCVLPQQLFLIPGFLLLLEWTTQKKEKTRLLLSFFFLLFGCLLESYVNPMLLKFVSNLI